MKLVKGIYVAALVLFIYWMLWVVSQVLLSVLVKQPTWQEQLLAYVVLGSVLLLAVLGVDGEGEEAEHDR